MAPFDVFRNPSPKTRRARPCLLDIQTNLRAATPRRVVVPLGLISEIGHPMQRINPAFTVEGVEVAMLTQEIASVPKQVLGEPVGSLQAWSAGLQTRSLQRRD